jgi:hypothetical protein
MLPAASATAAGAAAVQPAAAPDGIPFFTLLPLHKQNSLRAQGHAALAELAEVEDALKDHSFHFHCTERTSVAWLSRNTWPGKDVAARCHDMHRQFRDVLGMHDVERRSNIFFDISYVMTLLEYAPFVPAAQHYFSAFRAHAEGQARNKSEIRVVIFFFNRVTLWMAFLNLGRLLQSDLPAPLAGVAAGAAVASASVAPRAAVEFKSKLESFSGDMYLCTLTLLLLRGRSRTLVLLNTTRMNFNKSVAFI